MIVPSLLCGFTRANQKCGIPLIAPQFPRSAQNGHPDALPASIFMGHTATGQAVYAILKAVFSVPCRRFLHLELSGLPQKFSSRFDAAVLPTGWDLHPRRQSSSLPPIQDKLHWQVTAPNSHRKIRNAGFVHTGSSTGGNAFLFWLCRVLDFHMALLNPVCSFTAQHGPPPANHPCP